MVSAVDGANTTSFVYGPDGARLKKTTNGTVTLYLGEDVEITSGQYLKYLPGDAKKTGSGGSGTLYWMHRDHLQSVRAVTRSTGALDDSSAYRPFGEQLGFAGATPQSKGYIGERLDDKTQLLYLHARYYDPALGRFMQADPSNPTGAGVGVNRYAYALNNPEMMLDPFGLNSGEARDNRVGGGIANRGENSGVSPGGACADAGGGGPFVPCAGCTIQQQNLYDSVYANLIKTGVPQITAAKLAELAAMPNEDMNATVKAIRELMKNLRFSTTDDAAIAALSVVDPLSIDVNLEIGGNIYKVGPNQYGITGPKLYGPTHGNIRPGQIPADTTLAGDYHTHGDYSIVNPATGDSSDPVATGDPNRDDYESDDFSDPGDIQRAQGLANAPFGWGNDYNASYMAGPGGDIKKFDPHGGLFGTGSDPEVIGHVPRP